MVNVGYWYAYYSYLHNGNFGMNIMLRLLSSVTTKQGRPIVCFKLISAP